MHIRRNPLIRTAAAVTVALGLTAGVTACASDDNDSGTITIGSTEADKSQWKVFKEKASEAGLDVEVTPFSDYNTPNRALEDGSLDVNQFQHIQFLAQYNVESGSDLKVLGATEIFPMGIYSKDAKTVEDIEKAGEVVIPNDNTNGGRAIFVLEKAGLVTLKSDDVVAPTPADIDTAKSKVKVKAVDASQTAVAYNDGAVAAINNNFMVAADVTPDDAIIKDDPDDPAAAPYINVWAARADDIDNEDYLKLVELFHDPDVQKAVQEDTSGSAVEVTGKSQDDLNKILEDTEEQFREQGTGE
ncbi:MetQ/NlpA family ABC transporter substrate-binding protein [Corynebacterium variabile]|uniref:MetQ/NlpA family ABC transporter substrate-binding protein n=1 Tax=Corynebacterium variabile TaxID=1727 RepID=UPI001D676FEA|nr:MetQ/NlpA family ABC transporter substrate-binding protein [Corynebacterium variabile]HJG45089.1 MetQ/NlpA family ABC transporter substrate-binding protein [Corynebacterium variabile]